MKTLMLLVILGCVVWTGYKEYAAKSQAEDMTSETQSTTSYSCDGRTRCSEMNSCEEATFFLNNCPGVKMDGDNDGICESQWCVN